MASHGFSWGRALIIMTAAVLAVGTLTPVPAAKKMEPEEVIGLHLDAIGPADAREGMKSRIFRGQGVWRVLQGGRAQLPGVVYQTSDGESISLRFDTQGNPTYYGEHLVYNGDDVQIYQGFQNGRSPLGEFYIVNKGLIKEGLMGGATSTAWPLLHLDPKGVKLKYAGLKKADGVELHRIDYKAKGTGPANIQLYFEPDTYRHVRTEYSYEVPGGIGANPDASAAQQSTYVNVTETFSDFQEIDGLTLPVKWKILYDRSNQGGGKGSFVAEWEFSFTSAVHNQPLDPALYELGAKAE